MDLILFSFLSISHQIPEIGGTQVLVPYIPDVYTRQQFWRLPFNINFNKNNFPFNQFKKCIPISVVYETEN